MLLTVYRLHAGNGTLCFKFVIIGMATEQPDPVCQIQLYLHSSIGASHLSGALSERALCINLYLLITGRELQLNYAYLRHCCLCRERSGSVAAEESTPEAPLCSAALLGSRFDGQVSARAPRILHANCAFATCGRRRQRPSDPHSDSDSDFDQIGSANCEIPAINTRSQLRLAPAPSSIQSTPVSAQSQFRPRRQKRIQING